MLKLVPWLVFASLVALCAPKVRAQSELDAVYAELGPYTGPAAAEATRNSSVPAISGGLRP